MARDFDKYTDVIDSRDVIARIAELESNDSQECPVCDGTGGEDETCGECGGRGTVLALGEDEREELETLHSLADEASGYAPDWERGATLIRDSYFTRYAQDTAEDCGMIPDGASWPCRCIDWEQAARELQMDYTAVDFDGVTYWVR